MEIQQSVLEKINPQIVERIRGILLTGLQRTEPFRKGIEEVAHIACEAGIDREDVYQLVREILVSPGSITELGRDLGAELNDAYHIVSSEYPQAEHVEPDIGRYEQGLASFLQKYDLSQLITRFFSDLVLQESSRDAAPDPSLMTQWVTNGETLRNILRVVADRINGTIDSVYQNSHRYPYRFVEEGLGKVFNRLEDGYTINIEKLREMVAAAIRQGVPPARFTEEFERFLKERGEFVPFVEMLIGISINRCLSDAEAESISNGHFPANMILESIQRLWDEVLQEMKQTESARKAQLKRKQAEAARRNGKGKGGPRSEMRI